MIRVLFVSRATLFTQAGGDTLQMEQTAFYLQKENVQVTIYHGQNVREEDFDILHFFNICRPADLIRFTDWAIPKVISAIYIDYTEYDQKHRNGFTGWLARIAGSHGMEYMKTVARGLKAKDRFPPLQYLLHGQKSSVKHLLKSCAIVITASRQEEKAIRKEFGHLHQVSVIPLGSEHFPALSQTNTKRSGIVCAARIEGLKNQLNLIRALKGTAISLKLIGKSAENQPGYIEECKVLAEDSMLFTGPLTREELAAEFQKAKVHVLPSYYETTGLSTVEALKSGCQVVITKRGAQAEIFGNHAFYCDPDDPQSIRAAVKKALDSHVDHTNWVQSAFSWVSAAKKISDIYRSLLQKLMRIGILGSRGIPNRYGGFEECAEQLAIRWTAKGHKVYVYNSHEHPYPHKQFKGVSLIHKYDPELRIGTAGQFIYDLNSLIDSHWREFDILLMLGYTSSSVWKWVFPKKPVIITNMDGLEWKRSKYSRRVQKFLKRAERWAANSSDVLVADAKEIQRYLNDKYQRGAVYIPYGSDTFKDTDESVLEKYGVEPRQYNLAVARLEPENNLEIILQGVQKSESERVLLVVGNHETPYGEYLKKTFKDSRIRFVKASYQKKVIHNLRYFSHLYFHGHTVGGTNPSLLEAMGCKCVICAHDNAFNREVLGEDGNYFLDVNDIANVLDHLERNPVQKQKIKNNLEKLKTRFNWDIVADQYEVVFQQALIR